MIIRLRRFLCIACFNRSLLGFAFTMKFRFIPLTHKSPLFRATERVYFCLEMGVLQAQFVSRSHNVGIFL